MRRPSRLRGGRAHAELGRELEDAAELDEDLISLERRESEGPAMQNETIPEEPNGGARRRRRRRCCRRLVVASLAAAGRRVAAEGRETHRR